MSLRIAIPEPTSSDHAYNARSLPQYIAALQSAGATAVIIPLHERQDRVARLLSGVSGILLPGSGFDVEPQAYGDQRIPECGEADPARTAVDELLLQDAFNLHKPVLAICYGLQALNVWRGGTLIQDLAADGKSSVNHAPGREVINAHPLQIAPGSLLSKLAGSEPISVNSSHHQAVRVAGDNLAVTATCPTDGVIEGMELVSADHFVLAVQWHPERTYTSSAFSRAIFSAFVHAAQQWHPRPVAESVTQA
jgi:putative glutamine amidotransferase